MWLSLYEILPRLLVLSSVTEEVEERRTWNEFLLDMWLSLSDLLRLSMKKGLEEVRLMRIWMRMLEELLRVMEELGEVRMVRLDKKKELEGVRLMRIRTKMLEDLVTVKEELEEVRLLRLSMEKGLEEVRLVRV